MFCWNCGKQVSGKSRFCWNCGAEIIIPSSTRVTSSQLPIKSPENASTRPQPYQRNKTLKTSLNKRDGSIEYFTELYLGQPYERDANDFAYEKVKALLGDSPDLQELHAFWMPKKTIEDQAYEEVYGRIDAVIAR